MRILVGEADGTNTAAAMYDSTSGWMIGPIWETPEAVEQIEAFLEWLRRLGHVAAVNAGELDLLPGDLLRGDGDDPRAWTDAGLEKLLVYWRGRFLVDGYLGGFANEEAAD